jgi:hypothetical protein
MVGFRNIKSLVDAEEKGQVREYCFRKAPNVVTTAGFWIDLSLSPGNPSPQYYAATPMESIALAQSTDGGLFTGGNVSPYKKHLTHLELQVSSVAMIGTYYLQDYLLFYPFIAEDTTDDQPLTQVDPLPRYTDGAGVQIMAVSVGARGGGQTFRVGYTNQDGVSGRYTATTRENTITTNGNILSSDTAQAAASGPYLTLQSGDTGVRQIDSFQMVSGTDVGLVTLVLVKPLATFTIISSGGASDVIPFITQGGTIPQIEDDAYLNFIMCPGGSISGSTIFGSLKVVYN